MVFTFPIVVTGLMDQVSTSMKTYNGHEFFHLYQVFNGNVYY